MARTNNNHGKRSPASNSNNEGNKAKRVRVEDPPPNTPAKHDNEQRKHRMSVENNLKAALRNESYATDEFLRNLSLEVTTCFTALTTKVYLVSNFRTTTSSTSRSENKGRGKKKISDTTLSDLGPIPRQIDVMVNLFLSEVDNGVTGVLQLLTRKQISERFKDYDMSNKWLNFESLLGNVDEEIGGAALYGRNVVNYGTIKKNSFVLGTTVLSGEKWVPVGFHRQGDTNVLKTGQVILPLHSSLAFHNVIHYKDTVSNYYNIHFKFNDNHVTLSPCKLGTGNIRLAPFTDTTKGILYLVNECLIRKVVDPCKNLGKNVVRPLEPACIQFISQVLCASMIELEVNDSSFDCSIDNVCKLILPKVLKATDNGCFHYDHVMETIEDLVLTERRFLAGAMLPELSDKNFAHVNFEDTREQLVTGILELSGLDDKHNNETCVTRFLQYDVNSQQEAPTNFYGTHSIQMGTIFTPLTGKLAGYLLEKSDDLSSANLLVQFLDDNVVNNYGKGMGELNPVFSYLQGYQSKTMNDRRQQGTNEEHVDNPSKPSGIDRTKGDSNDAGTSDGRQVTQRPTKTKGRRNNECGSTDEGNTIENRKELPVLARPLIRGLVKVPKYP
eukprot:jgi/Psemu1/15559/gm1.15559_g